MDPDHPKAARSVLESDDGAWWGPGDFSLDGRYLLLQQYISVEDSRIYLKDLQNGEMRLLAGNPDAPYANRVAAFDRKEVGLYFTTNARGLAGELAWMPLARDRGMEFITHQIPWDVSEFAISDDGSRAAFVTNEAGISQLYLMNTRNHIYERVEDLPIGLIFGLSFNPDSRRLAMTMNTAQTPSDVFVMKLGRQPTSSGPLTRWTFSEVGGLDTDRFVEPELVHYPTFDMVGESQRHVPAFVYRPMDEGPHPVVIYIHGGPESQYRPAFSSAIQTWVVELGTAVIAPNVRGSTGYGFEYLSLDDGMNRENAVRDIGALLDWIAVQPDLDQNRVALLGGSYGGYMVLASAVHYSDRLSAAVDVVGISNFVTFLENTQDYRRALRRAEYGDERDPEVRAFLEGISPLTNADRIDIPMLVVQGENDPRVPASEAAQIIEALRKRDVPVWYMNALNEGHGYARKENRDVYEQAVVLFLNRYLVN
jgi:dipeptidyl aminopeptidase/acylaminoacyl peptidase